ncbi:hypothetical protein [Parasutterella excrementihominis]|uniref:hypothetical protein n=1 Tax=Parasutterella excrementihominis TaxID=487175 RepID=UPI0022E4E677|nr:hypothetical protein [Parasutterella excrementihominis]
MAKSLREVEEQMSSVGIDVPPGVDLVVNGSNWKRFKPANSHFKRGKEAYYGIWEKSLGSGRNYYFGVFGIGSQSYKITHTRSGWTQEEWREIKSRTETDQKIVDEALQERRRSAGQKAVKMLQAAKRPITGFGKNPSARAVTTTSASSGSGANPTRSRIPEAAGRRKNGAKSSHARKPTKR